MTLEEEHKWKEFDEKVLEKAPNFTDYQKEVLKAILELYYEDRKNSILKNDSQANSIKTIINEIDNNFNQ